MNMKDFSEITELAILNIENTNQLERIKNIVSYYGWKYIQVNMNFPTNLYLKQGEANHWPNKNFLLMKAFNNRCSNISAWRFLDYYQVPFEYKGYKGSYEKSVEDNCWHGKILNGKKGDLILYESSSLIGLNKEFNEAVDDYIETMEQIKKKEMNMKELRWEVVSNQKGYCLFDYKTDEYLTVNGIVVDTDDRVYWPTSIEAQEFLEDLCENNLPVAYRRSSETIFTDEVVEEINADQSLYMVDSVVEAIMTLGISFTRHDVIKGMRQVMGPTVELEYTEWKDLIVESIENNLDLYDYNGTFKDGRFTYSLLEDNDDDILDGIDNNSKTVDSATTQVIDHSTPVKDTSEPEKWKRYTITAEAVRNAKGYPGAIMHILVCEMMIIMHNSPNEAHAECIKQGSPTILLESKLKVDKNCNIRISKYMFDLAGFTKDAIVTPNYS